MLCSKLPPIGISNKDGHIFIFADDCKGPQNCVAISSSNTINYIKENNPLSLYNFWEVSFHKQLLHFYYYLILHSSFQRTCSYTYLIPNSVIYINIPYYLENSVHKKKKNEQWLGPASNMPNYSLEENLSWSRTSINDKDYFGILMLQFFKWVKNENYSQLKEYILVIFW